MRPHIQQERPRAKPNGLDTPPPLELKAGWQTAMPVLAECIAKGLLYKGSTTLIYGAPKSGKSFLATDLALAVAAGRDSWMGVPILCGGPVVYFAAEGHAGFWKRLRAAMNHYGWDMESFPARFVLASGRFSLIRSDDRGRTFRPDATAVLGVIDTVHERFGAPVAVFIDTVFRTFGSGNVNASDHMNAYLAATAEIAERDVALGALHHETKAGGSAAGSVSLIGGSDAVVHVERSDDGTRSWEVEYSKDEAETGKTGFKLETVPVGLDLQRQPATSCIVVPEGVPEPKRKGPKVAPAAGVGMRALKLTMAKVGAQLPPLPDYPANTTACTITQWRDEFYRLKGGNNAANRQAFNRAQDYLLKDYHITQRDDLVWLVGRDKRDS